MNKKNKEADSENKLYYEVVDTKYQKIFFVKFNRGLYDELALRPNYEKGVTYEKVIEQLKANYETSVIRNKENPINGDNDTLFVTPPNRRRDNIEEDFSENIFFTLLISKKFIIKNKKSFLNLLANLILEGLISYVSGKLAFYSDGRYVFINLNVVLKSGGTPFIMPKIYSNFDNIRCLFKHKRNDRAFLFCETNTCKYSIDAEHDECWHYTFDFVENTGQKYWASGAYIYVNKQGNVRIDDASEKFTVLTREIYAKNLDEGLNILKNEMKNLGFDVKISEKGKRRERRIK